MIPATLSHRILSVIYPLKETDRRRQPDKPLSVLALGLSRSGTDSLRRALEQLGYTTCYHGTVAGGRPRDCKVWCRLMAYKEDLARQRGLIPSTDPDDKSWWHFDSGLTREDFDPMLADCRAVTDLPCIMFIDELIRCYPEAKVIVNYREDIDAWHASIKATAVPVAQNWFMPTMSLFSTEFFWWFHAWRLTFHRLWEPWNWDARGRPFHREHYAHLKKVSRQHGRETLEWKAQDSWMPLCEFLGQPVPDTPFPYGNTTPQFQARFKRTIRNRYLKSIRNIGILLSIIFGSTAWIYRARLPGIWLKLGNLVKDGISYGTLKFPIKLNSPFGVQN